MSRPTLLCLGAAALFGASTPASKALLGATNPLVLAGLLYLGAAFGAAPFALRSGMPSAELFARSGRSLSGVVLFGGFLGPLLFLWGLSQSPAASVALWLNVEGAATALLAWAVFREHLGGRMILAIALIGAASLLLANHAAIGVGTAAILVVLACICWAIDNNLTSLIDGFTPSQITLVKGLFGGCLNLGLGLHDGGPHLSLTAAAGGLVVGSISYGASLLLYITASRQLGAARSQLIFATAPFWGLSLSWILLAEPIQRSQVAAGVVMLGALWLFYTERHEHAHTHIGVTHHHWHRHDDGHHEHLHPGLPGKAGHSHVHSHGPTTHVHSHLPDLHHRHGH